jgi:hypothetical protein
MGFSGRCRTRPSVRRALPLLGLCVVLGLSGTAAGAQESEVSDAPAAAPAPEAFAIFPWDILKPSPEAYRGAKECGFNLAGFVHAEDLDMVRDAGLKCFVVDPRIKIRGNEKAGDDEIAAAAKGVTAGTASNPAVFGYHLIDEPAKALVPTVAKWAKAFQSAAPERVAFTNFLPIFGPGAPAAREAAYEQYLTSYLDDVKPRAFSFDQYGIFADGSIRPTYFQCLEVVRRASTKTNVPFWHVALAIAHFNYAEPNPAMLRFQVFASLAYGAKGIGWFTYTGRDRGNYRDAAIDLDGRRTPTWAMLRDANQIAHRLAPVYTTLKSVNVFHHPTVPLGCRGLAESKFVADVQGTGPFCVGEFEDPQGRPALVVVNCDLAKSTQVNVVPKQKSTILRVSSLTGRTRPWGAEDNWLAPGQGLLLVLAPPTTGP